MGDQQLDELARWCFEPDAAGKVAATGLYRESVEDSFVRDQEAAWRNDVDARLGRWKRERDAERGVTVRVSAVEEVAPPEYFAVLAHTDVPERGGFVCCPVCESGRCQVWGTVERGWHCWACGAGRNVYHLAARLWGTTTRGRDFVRLREELERKFGIAA